MTHPRLSLAFEDADALPSAGTVLVYGPQSAGDLAELPRDRVVAVQSFRPSFDALQAAGYSVVPDVAEASSGFAAAVVFLPRSRDEARARIAEAAARSLSGAPIWIDGQKTDGADSMLKDLRRLVAVSAPISKAHGKIFRFDAPGDAVFESWKARDLRPEAGFVTRPGVFSAEKVDHGSRLLAEALPDDLDGTVADLGAGWGWLSARILARPGVGELHLVEADHAALACAKANIRDERARFHWADATRFRADAPLDAVVMNPPFHAGRASDPAIGAGFIEAAAGMLQPSGALYMVANRHLPYEAVLKARFREVAEVGGDSGFKVIHAARPTASPRARR